MSDGRACFTELTLPTSKEELHNMRNHNSKLLPPEENRTVDFICAVAAGVGVAFSMSPFESPSFAALTPERILTTVIGLCSFALIALLLSSWKGATRAAFGWLVIALLGSVIFAAIYDFRPRAYEPGGFPRGFNAFPIDAVFASLVALLIMVLAQSFVLILRMLRQRSGRIIR